jgi:hypothetical protein
MSADLVWTKVLVLARNLTWHILTNREVIYSCKTRHVLSCAMEYIKNMSLMNIFKCVPSGLKVGYVKREM